MTDTPARVAAVARAVTARTGGQRRRRQRQRPVVSVARVAAAIPHQHAPGGRQPPQERRSRLFPLPLARQDAPGGRRIPLLHRAIKHHIPFSKKTLPHAHPFSQKNPSAISIPLPFQQSLRHFPSLCLFPARSFRHVDHVDHGDRHDRRPVAAVARAVTASASARRRSVSRRAARHAFIPIARDEERGDNHPVIVLTFDCSDHFSFSFSSVAFIFFYIFF